MGYLLLADSHTYVCWSWDDLGTRLVWARDQGYRSAKARRANGWVDRPLLASEQAQLVQDATATGAGVAGSWWFAAWTRAPSGGILGGRCRRKTSRS